MKLITTLLLVFLLLPTIIYAQTSRAVFKPLIQSQVTGSYRDDIAVGDIDNDGDLDMVISGNDQTGQATFIYVNDGLGNFEQRTDNSLRNLELSALQLFDIENDGDLDLISSGFDGFSRRAQINRYAGNYNFLSSFSSSFTANRRGSISIGDIDGDNDIDIFMSGASSTGSIAEVYRNTGFGSFTTLSNTALLGVYDSNSEFFDADGDGDLDLLVIGRDAGTTGITNLYLNNGNGGYTLSNQTFLGLFAGDVSIADVDGDNDLDIFLCGRLSAASITSILYLNNGSGGFTSSGNAFTAVWNSSSEFFDFDNDGDEDIIYIGEGVAGNIGRLYENNGLGGYTLAVGFSSTEEGTLKVFDFDNDGDIDIVLTGLFSPAVGVIATIFENDGAGSFSAKTGPDFVGVSSSASAFTDLSNNGYPDLFVTGSTGFQADSTEFYLNEFNNNGTLAATINPYVDLSNGTVNVFDMDGDNDEDVLLTGYSSVSNTPRTILYRKNAALSLSVVAGTPFDDISTSSVDIADIDGDNDLDVVMSGLLTGGFSSTRLYRNGGTGNFSNTGQSFIQVSQGAMKFGDIDNDNDQDLIITGINNGNFQVKLYENNGMGVFTAKTNVPFDSLINSTVQMFDIDNDGDLDVLMAGFGQNQSYNTKIYLNSGTGNFTEKLNTGLVQLSNAASKVFDFDKDGDLDFIISGSEFNGDTTVLYENDGNGNFIPVNFSFLGFSRGSISIADVDLDGKEDVFLSGSNTPAVGGTRRLNRLYLNFSCANTDSVFTVTSCGQFTLASGVVVNTSGAYNDTIINTEGCDSILTYNITIFNSTVASRVDSACESFQTPSGAVLTSTGVYTDVIQNAAGCDSIITIDLTILKSNVSISVSACSSYVSPSGKIFVSTGMYSDTLINRFNCDSIISIDLSILQTDTIFAFSVCDSFVSPSGNTYGSSQTVNDTISNSFNCDSIITILLTVRNSTVANETVSSCGQFTSASGKVFVSSGTYLDTIQNSSGCDSLITYQLLILNTTASVLNDSTCLSYTLPNGRVVTQNGTYNDTLLNSVGCDSIITFNLTFLENRETISVTECVSYTSPTGNIYSSTGTYVDTLLNQYNCDSILTINLIINQSSSSLNIAACNQYSSPSGRIKTVSEVFNDTIPNSIGCDSIMTIDLTINSSSFDSLLVVGCNSFITSTGREITVSGLTSDTLQNAAGCDSVLVYQATILQSTASMLTANSCGDYTAPSGKLITQSGMFNDTISNSRNCDSIITINLAVTSIDTSISKNRFNLMLSELNASRYEWFECIKDSVIANSDSVVFSAEKNGAYAAVIYKNNCVDTTRCVSVIGVGIEESSLVAIDWTFYPNPSKNWILISLNGLDEVDLPLEIEIYNSVGKVVKKDLLTERKQRISLAQFSAGLYYIKLSGDTKKLMLIK